MTLDQTLFFTDSGSGDAVILLHGMVGSHRYWDKIIPRLKSSYRVIAFDLLGFGQSPKPKDIEYTLDDHISALMKSIDSLNLKTFILVGHSMGSIISLGIADKYPDRVTKLVLISMPIYKTAADAKQKITRSKIMPKLMLYGLTARITCTLVCYFHPLMKRLAPIFITNVPKNVAVDSLDHTWHSYSRSMLHVIQEQDVLGQLNLLSMPTTILVGLKDAIINEYEPNKLGALSTNITVRLMDTTHQLPLEDPSSVLKAIRD